MGLFQFGDLVTENIIFLKQVSDKQCYEVMDCKE